MTVEKLVYGGEGLARLDGRVVLAPYVLPGERVKVRVETEKPRLVRAGLVEVIATAAERVAAPCPYYRVCGGCHYQHAPYELQLAAKRAILEEELRRLGKIEPPPDIQVISGEPWNYRNRAQFHIRGAALGYLEAHSHRLCPIAACPISSPKLNEAIAVLREMLRDARWPRFIRSLEVFTDERQVQLDVLESGQPVARRFFEWFGERMPEFTPGALDYAAAGETYQVSRGSFFQVNRYLVDKLVETAIGEAAGESALDLYAGVGLFALPLARRFGAVTAVESGGTAVRDLQFNASRAGLAVTAEQATAEVFLERYAGAPNLVLLDPPRAGLGKQVVHQLARIRAPRVVIVACDPATLARDLAGLLAAGYSIERMALLDLFPQTYHLETVVHLRATPA